MIGEQGEVIMSTLLSTIALLCQIQTGGPTIVVEKAQVACQKYYVRCVKRESGNDSERLQKCILTRIVKSNR